MNKREMKKICILKGGDSSERKISLITGKSYADALKSSEYGVWEFDFNGDIYNLISHLKIENPCCVVNALHGGSGENGNIQSLLNLMKIPYTHSGVLASSISMDKYISGNLLAQNGIQVPKNMLISWKEFIKNPNFPTPFIIKPVDGGSSNGVYIIEDTAVLYDIDWVFGRNVYVNEYVPGLELTVGIINNKAVEVTNIAVESGFYDYNNKYNAGRSYHELPAKIPSSIRKQAMELAERAHNLFGCRGVSRVDFRYNDVTQELFMLELNTQPGMTPVSLLPEQARYVGMSFDELAQLMIEQSCYDGM
jgi:D-alanine-D-alanine ligase